MSQNRIRILTVGMLVTFSLSIFSPLPNLIADEVDELLKQGKGKSSKKREMPDVYPFHQYLSEAEATILSTEKKMKGKELKREVLARGIWQQDRFTFQGYKQDVRIRNEVHTYGGVSEAGIFFHPIQNAIRRLRFPNVPTGRFMIVYYGIDDVGIDQGAKGATVYIHIWVGKHHLERIMVSNEKGWKKRMIDLGVLSFLKRDVPVTIEVSADNPVDRRLSFRAEIHQ